MANSAKNLYEIIQKNKQKKLVANKIIESNYQNIPVLSKLNRTSNSIIKNEDIFANINYSIFESIHTRLRNLKENNENIIKLFPDIELAIQILISSILSPKKMTNFELQYKIKDKITVPNAITTEFINKIKEYIDIEYEIEDKLPNILREALFNSGAYVVAIIPESSVDEVINSDILSKLSTESYKEKVDSLLYTISKPLNLISNVNENKELKTKGLKECLETIFISSSNVTDNYNILKLNNLKEKIRKSIIKKSINGSSLSLEDVNKIQYIDIFRERSNKTKPIEIVKTKKETYRKSIGKPLLYNIPTESIIPVINTKDKEKHIGYFVLLDENGNPLSLNMPKNFYNSISDIISGSTNQAQLSITQKAYRNLIYDNTQDLNTKDLFNTFKEIVEYNLYNTIKNSIYDSNVNIESREDIYYLMFARALSNQKTNILYLPTELVVYFAFNFNEVGIGKSLLENMNILASMRAIVLFSRIIAYTKQSIDVTKVNVSLDPNDPDPEKTIEQIQDKVLKLRQNYFPLGINNPVDLVDWIQRAGLQFAYENHPGLPNIQLNFENANLTHTVPSDELEEELRKRMIISLGLSPETVDSGFTPEFATTVVNNNILLSKRVMLYQKKLCRLLEDFIYKVVINDENIFTPLKNLIKNNIEFVTKYLTDDEKQLLQTNEDNFLNSYIEKILLNLEISLPLPENTNLTNLSAEFDIYKESLEKIIDSVVSTEIFSEDISGDLANHIDTIKNNIKHHLIRKWITENNFISEALDISKPMTKENKLLEQLVTYLYTIIKNSDIFLKSLQDRKEQSNKILEGLEGSSSESSSETSEEGGEETSEEGGKEGGEDIENPEDVDLNL